MPGAIAELDWILGAGLQSGGRRFVFAEIVGMLAACWSNLASGLGVRGNATVFSNAPILESRMSRTLFSVSLAVASFVLSFVGAARVIAADQADGFASVGGITGGAGGQEVVVSTRE